MRSIAYALPAFPGFTGPKTTPPGRCGATASRKEMQFARLSRKEAARRWHKARRFDRQTHAPGNMAARSGAPARGVLCAAVRLPRSRARAGWTRLYDAIAVKAGVLPARGRPMRCSGSSAWLAALAAPIGPETRTAKGGFDWGRKQTPTPCCRHRNGAAIRAAASPAARSRHMGRSPSPARCRSPRRPPTTLPATASARCWPGSGTIRATWLPAPWPASSMPPLGQNPSNLLECSCCPRTLTQIHIPMRSALRRASL